MMEFSKSTRKNPPSYRKEIFGILFFGLAFFVSLSLVSYHPTDPGFHAASTSPHIANLGGIIGAYLSDLLFTTFGLSAYALAGLLFLLSMLKFKGQHLEFQLKQTVYLIFLLLFTSTLLQLHFPQIRITGQNFAGGGIAGTLVGQMLIHYLNRVGSEIVTLTGLILSFILVTHLKLSNLMVNVYRLLSYLGSQWLQWMRVSFERGKKGILFAWRWLQEEFHSIFSSEEEEEKEVEVKIHKPRAPLTLVQQTKETLPQESATPPSPKSKTEEPKIYERADEETKSKKEDQLQFLKITGTGFTTPPLSLLDSDQQKVSQMDEGALKKSAQLLERKLMDYDVHGHVTEIHPGPVVTLYEFEPATGTKVNKIVNLESDLSLVMGGRSIRIVPHLPGKAAVGIEIPNGERETVWLKEIISSNVFQKSKSRLTLALGRDIKGRPMVTDLTKMPHLLMAGATGSGKSVGLNSMLVSLLYKSSPEEVRFILVDPKRLEFSIYENIPHLLLPVVIEPKKAVVAMKWAVKEMERRYRVLADAGTRNIASYNEKVEKGEIDLISEEEAKLRLEKDREAIFHVGKLYYLVIIIDELADLMMVASQEFEETVTRLAQMARASGIHMILATQRPSVDVITGLIKANFPARISYKVSAKHDSRTILDQIGSETLLGEGDMLFMPPSASDLTRIHGALVTESEIARVVTHIKEQGEPVFDSTILEAATDTQGELEDLNEEDTEIYDKAVRLVAETGQASISMIQRRLRIGYNRAARMVEKMEADGVVGPADGAKPRQVLIQNLEP